MGADGLVTVRVATPLRSYTGAAKVTAAGSTVGAVLEDLDAKFPGLRFRLVDEQERLRPHMKIFVGTELAREIDVPVPAGSEISILQALSGG